MKHLNYSIFLSVLMVLLSTSAFSQSIQRVEHSEKRENIFSFNRFENDSIDLAIQFETNFYDLASRVDTINILRADSSNWRYVFSYDYRALVVSVIRQKFEEGEWVNFMRDNYSYFFNGDLHTHLLEKWDVNSGMDWVNYNRTTLDYLGGNVSSDLYELWNGAEWENAGLTEYENGSYGNHITAVIKYWDNGNWALEEKWLYDYSSNGENLLSKTSQEWNGAEWENDSRNLYDYDVDRRTSATFETWRDTAWKTISRYTYAYDENDNRTSSLYQIWNGEGWTNMSLYTYAYDSDGNNTSKIRQGWYNEDWVNYRKTSYSYDLNGNMILFLFEYWDNTENIWYPSPYDTFYRFYNGQVEHMPMGIRMDLIYNTYEPNVAPQDFSTIFPVLFQNSETQSPTFIWETAEDPGDVVNYTLYISDDSNVVENDLSAADSFFVGLDTTFALEDTLNEDSFYYWVVKAQDFYGAVTMSNISAFRVNSQNQTPGAVELITPTNNDSFEEDSVFFSWSESLDPDGAVDSISYSLFVASDSGMSAIVFELSDLRFVTQYKSVGDLEMDHHYWCYVSASDLQGATVYSDTVHFIVGNPVSVDDAPDNVPQNFSLEQNYPNPFNPTTMIGYVVARSEATRQSNEFSANANNSTDCHAPLRSARNDATAQVSLKVYDALGREVVTLVNKQQVPGKYSVRFEATDLPSGIYFYTLRAGNFIKTKKMILMK